MLSVSSWVYMIQEGHVTTTAPNYEEGLQKINSMAERNGINLQCTCLNTNGVENINVFQHHFETCQLLTV